jgi:site-specific recombinase XerD
MTTSPLAKLVLTFVEILSSEKGYSDNTCRAYLRDLEEFVTYVNDSRLRKSKAE